MLIQPQQDFGALEPGGAATAGDARRPSPSWNSCKAGDARVRITGQVALADEEFATVAQGAVVGLIGSVVLITLWLFLAVRTWRLIVPILVTLGLGLMLTLLFAALAVGHAEPGLGRVRRAVRRHRGGFRHPVLGPLPRDARFAFADPAEALQLNARSRRRRRSWCAAAATAAGFLAFVPTDFSGVAELGLIAGVGMLIAFVCTHRLPARRHHPVPPARRSTRGGVRLGRRRSTR